MPMIFVDALKTHYPIVYVNDAFLALTGFKRRGILGRRFDSLFVGETPDVEMLVAKAHGDQDADVCCRGMNGKSYWATVFVSRIDDAHGVTTHFFASFVDRTRHIAERANILELNANVEGKANEIRVLQASIIAASRLSAMGMIGATIAHELNQPLSAITSYLRGIRLQIEASKALMPDGIVEALIAADQSAMRASHIIRRVRDASRRQTGTERTESLRSLVVEACDLAVADTTLNGVVTSLSFDGDDANVLVDRVEIQQVIINLIHNSLDAIAGRPRRKIFISVNVNADDFCEVGVRDTGTGIAKTAMSNLFKPFTTTKPDGVGIGLSISRTIIEAHGGRFWLASSTSNGTEFKFSLPLAPN